MMEFSNPLPSNSEATLGAYVLAIELHRPIALVLPKRSASTACFWLLIAIAVRQKGRAASVHALGATCVVGKPIRWHIDNLTEADHVLAPGQS